MMLLFFGISGVGPAWAAHLRHGVPGVFTSTSKRQDCTQSCSTDRFGTFTSRSATRVGVPLHPDGAQITAMHEAALYESDGWAYVNGGGPDWLITALMVPGGAALLSSSAIGLRSLRRTKSRAAVGPESPSGRTHWPRRAPHQRPADGTAVRDAPQAAPAAIFERYHRTRPGLRNQPCSKTQIQRAEPKTPE